MGLITGVALMAGGAIYQGMAQSAQGKSAQNMADYNAKLAEQNRARIEQKGKQDSIRQAEAASRHESSILAKIGQSGAVTQVGAPLDIFAVQAAEAERENLLIGYDTQVAASQQQSQADIDRMSGSVARQRGRNQATASYIQAGGSLLTGFGS